MPIKERNTSHMLWFDVEKRYKTIFLVCLSAGLQVVV